jgi:hypothetical protein
MSKASTPTISFVLPMYKLMDGHLQTLAYSIDDTLPPVLQDAALAGLNKLEKYYTTARRHHFYMLGTRQYFCLLGLHVG